MLYNWSVFEAYIDLPKRLKSKLLNNNLPVQSLKRCERVDISDKVCLFTGVHSFVTKLHLINFLKKNNCLLLSRFCHYKLIKNITFEFIMHSNRDFYGQLTVFYILTLLQIYQYWIPILITAAIIR